MNRGTRFLHPKKPPAASSRSKSTRKHNTKVQDDPNPSDKAAAAAKPAAWSRQSDTWHRRAPPATSTKGNGGKGKAFAPGDDEPSHTAPPHACPPPPALLPSNRCPLLQTLPGFPQLQYWKGQTRFGCREDPFPAQDDPCPEAPAGSPRLFDPAKVFSGQNGHSQGGKGRGSSPAREGCM